MKYTKRQIREAISYWTKHLRTLDEDVAGIDVKKRWPDGYKLDPEMEFKDFIEDVDLIANGGNSLYTQCVPEDTAEIEGTQRDVDDFDTYRIWIPDTIDEDSFYEQLREKLLDEFADDVVPLDEFADKANDFGQEIAEDALENYEPGEEQLTHRGRMHWGGYYPG